MDFKMCTLCENEFPATTEFFYKKKDGKDGLYSWCKKCHSDKKKEHYIKNRGYYLEKMRDYKKSDEGKEAARRYSQSEKGRTQQKRWRESEKGKVINKKYYQSDKGKLSHNKTNKKYFKTEKGKTVIYKARKKYINTPHGREVVRTVYSEWYKRNRLSSCISRRIRSSLDTDKSGKHWENIVDFTLDELKVHLEKLFQPGMTWDNYGKFGWHIDHKIPVSSFNIVSYDCDDFKKCWALDNLQPMWWRDNLIKGSKVEVNE